MTHDIVPGDIELATRLMKAGCQDSGIVAELCWRGVDEREAAGLVAALRCGDKVRVRLASGPSRRKRRRGHHLAPALPIPMPSPGKPWSRLRSSERGLVPTQGFMSVAFFTAIGLGLLYLVFADTGIVPGREHLSQPFVPIEDFNQVARSLTNGVGN